MYHLTTLGYLQAKYEAFLMIFNHCCGRVWNSMLQFSWIFEFFHILLRDRKLVVGFFLVRIPTSDSYFHLQYLPPIFYYCCKVSLLLCFYKDWEDDSINVTESNLKLVATVEWSFAHTSVYTIYLVRQGNNQKTNTCTCTLGKNNIMVTEFENTENTYF